MNKSTNGQEEGPRAPGRRVRKAAEMRERIFRAAIELIAERGLPHVTVEQITDKADVGKGTFFNYFPSKEAVLAYFGATQAQRLQDALAADRVRGTARERVECVLELLAREGEGDITQELARGLFIATLSNQRIQEVHGPNVWSLREVLGQIIREGQASGEFKPERDPEEAARFILGQYYLGMLSWCTGFADQGLVETVSRYCHMALEGLLVDEAHNPEKTVS